MHSATPQSVPQPRPAQPRWAAPLVVLACVAVACAAIFLQLPPPQLAAALAVAAIVGLLFFRPDSGTLLFALAVYANAAALVAQRVGSAEAVGALLCGLLCVPVVVAVFVRREGFVLDYTFLFLLLFLAVLLASTLGARHVPTAVKWVVNFLLEGVLVYFLVVNAVRRVETLKRLLWGLLFVGAFLATLSLYQELTHSYGQQFGGLAQRNLERKQGLEDTDAGKLLRSREKVYIANRAAGPIGDPNRYAQILLLVLPFAVFLARHSKPWLLRLLAVGAGLLVLGGVLATYSRGGLLTLALLLFFMIWMGSLRLRHVVFGVLLALALGLIVSPGFVARIQTIRELPGLISNRSVAGQGDGATRGRLTEMLAAAHVFLDYPVLGVGPGHFTPFYSMDYMSQPEVSFRTPREPRRAHNLYLEIAAETGILGLLVFVGMVLVVLYRLERRRQHWKAKDPERAQLAAALWLSIVGYLTTGLFLQLSFQRYYWMFLALAGAAIQLLTARGEAPPTAVRPASQVRSTIPAEGAPAC